MKPHRTYARIVDLSYSITVDCLSSDGKTIAERRFDQWEGAALLGAYYRITLAMEGHATALLDATLIENPPQEVRSLFEDFETSFDGEGWDVPL